MDDAWSFEFTSSEGRSLVVEAAGVRDIWVWHKAHVMRWADLSVQDQETIMDRVEQHFFMRDAEKQWSQR